MEKRTKYVQNKHTHGLLTQCVSEVLYAGTTAAYQTNAHSVISHATASLHSDALTPDATATAGAANTAATTTTTTSATTTTTTTTTTTRPGKVFNPLTLYRAEMSTGYILPSRSNLHF